MSNSSSLKLQCYNRGCGQQYDPDSNTEDACTFHPGMPVFHDAYKGWSCCNKKTTDFTDFLNIQGCRRSFHNNVKPPEPEKPKVDCSDEDKTKVYTYQAPVSHRMPTTTPRPSEDAATVKLPYTVGSSLKPLLEALSKSKMEAEDGSGECKTISIGTLCKNSGCKQAYQGEHTSNETCCYHSGVPIFHEGMKYWSCCTRRTTDFEMFLEQIGCTTGKHMWIKNKNAQETVPCRYDWHQTGSFVVVSVYSKAPQPELSSVEASAIRLHMHIVFGANQSVFDMEWLLFGVIQVEQSGVTYMGSKVEIKLKKADPIMWSELALPIKTLAIQDNKQETLDNVDVKS